QLLQAAVARRDGAVAVGHTHHGLAEIGFLVAHAVVHGAVGGARFALGDVVTAKGNHALGTVGHGVSLGFVGEGLQARQYAAARRRTPIRLVSATDMLGL